MAKTLCIQATTLNELITALGVSGRVTVRLQKSLPNAERYIISKETLDKIADEIRAADGTTDEIPVAELAERILSMQDIATIKLATPEIYLYDDVSDEPIISIVKLATPVIHLYDDSDAEPPVSNTSAILGEAILGKVILGNASYDDTPIVKLETPVIHLDVVDDELEEPTIIKLATPEIYLEVVDDDENVEPTIIKLATPEIYLEVVDDDENVEPDIPVVKLTTPVISLYEETESEPEEPDIPDGPITIQLATPVIYSYDDETDEPDVPDVPVVKLTTPVIYLYDDTEDDELSGDTTAILGKAILGRAILGNASDDNTNVVKLATPVIYLVDEDAVTTIKLATPEIYLEVVEDEIVEPDIPVVKLTTPVISLYEETESEPEEPDIPDETITVKLATPVIKLIDVTDNAVKMTFDNYGYIDFTGTIVSSNMGGKRYSDIVAISDLANGPDGHCVQDFDTFEEYPKVVFLSGNSLDTVIRGFTRTEIGDKDRLTVAEIKALAATVPNAKYVAFNSDFEDESAEDYAYIMNGAQTFKPEAPETPITTKLATPVIELVEIEDGGEVEPEEPEEPETPITTKLATPVIELVEIEDGGEVEPEEPEEPETPITTKLATPYIELVVVEDTGGEDSGDDSGGGSSSGGVTDPTPGGDATEDQM